VLRTPEEENIKFIVKKSRCQNPHYGHYDNGRTRAIRRKGAFGTAGDFNTPKNDVPADHHSDNWYHRFEVPWRRSIAGCDIDRLLPKSPLPKPAAVLLLQKG